MPSIATSLAARLQRDLQLVRAVETGTYLGDGALRLADAFERVVTIELSTELHAAAVERFASSPRITALQGHSVNRLVELADDTIPTLWFLDGHWSGGATAGMQDECPVLREIAVIGGGHPHDVVIVDDARYFTAAPPPPHDADQWPTLVAVIDALRTAEPGHHVTLLDDQVIAVPASAKAVVDDYGRELIAADVREAPSGRASVGARARAAVRRLRRAAHD